MIARPGKSVTQEYDLYPVKKDGAYVIGDLAEFETLWWTGRIDPRFSRAGTYVCEVTPFHDHLHVKVSCAGSPFWHGTFKVTYLLWWGAIML